MTHGFYHPEMMVGWWCCSVVAVSPIEHVPLRAHKPVLRQGDAQLRGKPNSPDSLVYWIAGLCHDGASQPRQAAASDGNTTALFGYIPASHIGLTAWLRVTVQPRQEAHK
jgi:hypothetical protein